MKTSLIAMCAAGAALLVWALFWNGGSSRTVESTPRRSTESAMVTTTARQQVNPQRTAALTPSPRVAAAMPKVTNRVPAEKAAPAATDSNLLEKDLEIRETNNPQLTPDEELTIRQTATDSTSLRNFDFPRTYISAIRVDLTSPHHWVRLTWTGPQASHQPTGPFHSSPGAGLGSNDCDDVTESHRENSNCTPKGTMHVQGFTNSMVSAPNCRFVTWFDTSRGVAVHYYPVVPNYPASHGCVRIEDIRVAQLIHNNSKIGATEVTVEGKWTRGR
jgi:hypothetical protein